MIVGMPTTSFPRHEGDPSGAFVLGMARALARRGDRVDVLAPEPDGPGPCWTDPAPGVRVRWIAYARPRALQRTFHRAGAPENLARDPLAWLGAATFPIALGRALLEARRSWDAIASHWGVPSGLLAGALAGPRPHVAFLHSADVHAIARLPAAPRAALAGALVRRASALVFVTDDLRARLLSCMRPADRVRAASRAHTIPMGIEPVPSVPRAAARDAVGARGFTLLAMSRLVPIKGLDRAIAALEGVDGVELAIAGEGPERARLEREATARRVAVRFLGVISGLDKARWLAAADALIAPSVVLASGRAEGAPTAVFEAMSAGLPVLATDTGGLPEIVEHGRSGWIVPATLEALREGIVRLAADPALRARLSEGARLRAREASWDVIVPRLQTLLGAASAAPPCAPDTDHGSTRRAAAGGRNANSASGTATFSS